MEGPVVKFLGATALALMALTTAAQAQTRTFYNDRGQVTGQATTRGDNRSETPMRVVN
jgi:hypothetical protein